MMTENPSQKENGFPSRLLDRAVPPFRFLSSFSFCVRQLTLHLGSVQFASTRRGIYSVKHGIENSR